MVLPDLFIIKKKKVSAKVRAAFPSLSENGQCFTQARKNSFISDAYLEEKVMEWNQKEGYIFFYPLVLKKVLFLSVTPQFSGYKNTSFGKSRDPT